VATGEFALHAQYVRQASRIPPVKRDSIAKLVGSGSKIVDRIDHVLRNIKECSLL
jgi:hypothetical protein